MRFTYPLWRLIHMGWRETGREEGRKEVPDGVIIPWSTGSRTRQRKGELYMKRLPELDEFICVETLISISSRFYWPKCWNKWINQTAARASHAYGTCLVCAAVWSENYGKIPIGLEGDLIFAYICKGESISGSSSTAKLIYWVGWRDVRSDSKSRLELRIPGTWTLR